MWQIIQTAPNHEIAHERLKLFSAAFFMFSWKRIKGKTFSANTADFFPVIWMENKWLMAC